MHININQSLNILLTSVGRRSYLVKYFKEALKDNGRVHVANSTFITPAFGVADASVVTPLIYSNEYIPFLLQYCKENDIKAIISLFDVDLPILAKNRDKFAEQGVFLVVSDLKIVETCNDKWMSYQYLRERGFNVPFTSLNLEEIMSLIAEGKVEYPLIIKPRWGMGSLAIYEADNEEELKLFYSKTKRNIQQTYLKYEAEQDWKKDVLIQQKLKGIEYGLDIINNLHGEYQTTIVKQKYAMRSGETDCAVTVSDPEMKTQGEKLGRVLKHIANLDVDVFRTDTGKIFVLEMNARFGGGYPFSHMAGVNLPKAIIKWLGGGVVEKDILTERYNVMSHKDIELVRIEER